MSMQKCETANPISRFAVSDNVVKLISFRFSCSSKPCSCSWMRYDPWSSSRSFSFELPFVISSLIIYASIVFADPRILYAPTQTNFARRSREL